MKTFSDLDRDYRRISGWLRVTFLIGALLVFIGGYPLTLALLRLAYEYQLGNDASIWEFVTWFEIAAFAAGLVMALVIPMVIVRPRLKRFGQALFDEESLGRPERVVIRLRERQLTYRYQNATATVCLLWSGHPSVRGKVRYVSGLVPGLDFASFESLYEWLANRRLPKSGEELPKPHGPGASEATVLPKLHDTEHAKVKAIYDTYRSRAWFWSATSVVGALVAMIGAYLAIGSVLVGIGLTVVWAGVVVPTFRRRSPTYQDLRSDLEGFAKTFIAKPLPNNGPISGHPDTGLVFVHYDNGQMLVLNFGQPSDGYASFRVPRQKITYVFPTAQALYAWVGWWGQEDLSDLDD